MPRSPRCFAVALLWLALALLPVRGFAALLMPVGTVPSPATAAADMGAERLAGAMPCHGAAASADAASGPSSTAGEPGEHTCSLCNLCHSGVAACTPPPLALPTLPQAAPARHAAPSLAPCAPDSLFRPPRSDLA